MQCAAAISMRSAFRLPTERQLYTLEHADRPNRVLIEQIQEGALTLSIDGAVLTNQRLAVMSAVPQERLIGQSLNASFTPTRAGLGHCSPAPGPPAHAARSVCASTDNWTSRLIFRSARCSATRNAATLRRPNRPEAAETASSRGIRRQRASQGGEPGARACRGSATSVTEMEAVGRSIGGVAHDFNNHKPRSTLRAG